MVYQEGAPLSANPNNIAAPTNASRADRALSFKVADFPAPTRRMEEWRFSPLEQLRPFFADVATAAAPTVSAEGIELEKVDREDPRLGQIGAPEDRVSALAWESATNAYIATIPSGVTLEHEAWIRVHGEGRDGDADNASSAAVAALEMLVDAGAHSQGTVIIEHTGAALLTEGVEVNVAEGAQLTLVTIQDWQDAAHHALSFRMRLGRDAVLKHIVVSLGGEIVRVTSALDYAGPGGDAELVGAYFAHEAQHLEHRLFVDHNQPNCHSNVVYKGALQGEAAHSVWVGDVLIRPEAEGIDTYELNRNLVLTEGARADSVPNLEIETGKIAGAGHASATGRFDDEQLFYLMSRGVPEHEARRLVVMGFFAELINQIGVHSVQKKLLDHIESELTVI